MMTTTAMYLITTFKEYNNMKTTLILLCALSLTACDNHPCDNLKSHNGEQQFCKDKQQSYGERGTRMAVKYIKSGAVAQPSESIFTMDSVLNLLKKANEVSL